MALYSSAQVLYKQRHITVIRVPKFLKSCGLYSMYSCLRPLSVDIGDRSGGTINKVEEFHAWLVKYSKELGKKKAYFEASDFTELMQYVNVEDAAYRRKLADLKKDISILPSDLTVEKILDELAYPLPSDHNDQHEHAYVVRAWMLWLNDVYEAHDVTPFKGANFAPEDVSNIRHFMERIHKKMTKEKSEKLKCNKTFKSLLKFPMELDKLVVIKKSKPAAMEPPAKVPRYDNGAGPSASGPPAAVKTAVPTAVPAAVPTAVPTAVKTAVPAAVKTAVPEKRLFDTASLEQAVADLQELVKQGQGNLTESIKRAMIDQRADLRKVNESLFDKITDICAGRTGIGMVKEKPAK